MAFKRYIVWVLWCTVVLATPMGVAVSGNGDDSVVIERNDIRLMVPKAYMYKNRFPWIDKASGLDPDEASFLIQIPREEIKSVLPDSVTQGKQEPINLTVVVSLMTPEEKNRSMAVAQAKADEVSNRQGTFQRAFEQIDEDTGFHFVYMNPEWSSWWEVFTRSPFDKSNPVSYRDSIASCNKDEHIGVSCLLSLFVLDNIRIEFHLKDAHLPYWKNVQEYITELLQSWRVEQSES